eukprot:TRINITY_DN1863_c0_g1_i2.p1 TRINITY_DN1863_c0_g1~~TRINITY_DN1863_c0_g1_i2.p1  ORF type:complete len:416 (+),score=126.51 TRINITY_DN1863_c0_g1_i2:483-1730(+)
MIDLVFYAVLSIGTSFLCSLIESSLLSVPYSYVVGIAEQGDANGIRMRQLKDSIDRPLAAILSLNTIAHTIGASGVGASTAAHFGDEYVTLSSAILTLLMLVFSEIIPKTVGASNCKSLIGFAQITIRIMTVITFPLVWICEMVGKLLGATAHAGTVSRDEVTTVADLAEEAGAINAMESQVIKSLLSLKELKVSNEMTPRSVIFTQPADRDIRYYQDHSEKHLIFSRIPVIENNDRDLIIGWVHRNDIFQKLRSGELNVTLREMCQPLSSVKEDEDLFSVFIKFLKNQTGKTRQIFVVLDEYDCTAGVITLEDVIEKVFGVEIVDEFDTIVDLNKMSREKAPQEIMESMSLDPADFHKKQVSNVLTEIQVSEQSVDTLDSAKSSSDMNLLPKVSDMDSVSTDDIVLDVDDKKDQ